MAMVISSSQMGMKPVTISSGKKKVKEADGYNGKNNTNITNQAAYTYDDEYDYGERKTTTTTIITFP